MILDGDALVILDQTRLPWRVEERRLVTLEDVAEAISAMRVRGAPLIGCVAAFGVAVALTKGKADDVALDHALTVLRATRPTAVNLMWALDRMDARLRPLVPAARPEAAWAEAEAIRAEDAAMCAAIGAHGLALLRGLPAREGRALRVMTHCNAGRLATAGMGTALAPIYAAHAEGLAVEVFVSETRPRNQGLLTAWELAAAGIKHTLIADNAAGLLLMRGEVDVVIVGADRIAANGDTANKVGTYLKALAAREAGVPFYVAAPASTFDAETPCGEAIPVEERAEEEVFFVDGLDGEGCPGRLRLASEGTRAANPAFDVTPASLVSGFITERGIIGDRPRLPTGNRGLSPIILAVARTLKEHRLNVGASGNVSARCDDGFLITPSGLLPERGSAADMVWMKMDGTYAGELAPSSEWRIHRDIYASVPEAGAVVHAHSPFATALACQRVDIPPFHYMIALFGGDSVRCAAYATFGTEALSKNVLLALAGRNACLLANHGMLVYGRDPAHALAQAIELESLCEQYWRACQPGPPVLLSEKEMAEAMERFRHYGAREFKQ